MEYQRLKSDNGEIVIKDAEEYDLVGLVDIYRSTFKIHNVLLGAYEEVLEYLKKMHSEQMADGGGFIVAQAGEKSIGGLLVKRHSLNEMHGVWKYNHMAIHSEYSRKGIGKALIQAADQEINDMIKQGVMKSAKIELSVSENEKDSLDFFKKCGFEIEGQLKSHYRHGELVYVLGKEFT